MKRKGFMAVASLTFSLLFLNGCEPATITTNAPDANDATVATAPVDTAAIESELLRIENDWPRVMKEKDGAAVRRVYADDAVIVYPDGSTGTREEDAKGTENGMVTADSAEMADLKVNVVNKDTAIVTGRTIFKNAKLNPPDTKPIDISGEYRFVDTFARRNGQWKLVAGISTKIQNMVPSASPGASPAAKPSPAAKASPATKSSPAMKDSPTMKAAPTP
ncbi:MAG: nuclear transport factor 2 family protein [Pyrinomonadaceae bacterium]|nr:nuclear transport factor 2 family protein [Pyrinomonadaceae bacterium]